MITGPRRIVAPPGHLGFQVQAPGAIFWQAEHPACICDPNSGEIEMMVEADTDETVKVTAILSDGRIRSHEVRIQAGTVASVEG